MNAGPNFERVAAAQAQPNIALIKYWGKRRAEKNLPAVGSLSVTLQTISTRTRVAFDSSFVADEFLLNGVSEADQLGRVTACLDILRKLSDTSLFARIESRNNFPTGAGLASSASGFAALVTAGSAALGLDLDDTQKSAIARQGSGSAARSIFGGFVEWVRGDRDDGKDSVGRQLLEASEWPLHVVIAITSTSRKAIGSSQGMNHTSQTSPYQCAWVETQDADLAEAREALRFRDFDRLASVSEHSCLKMHALAMAARPGLLYWNGATMELIQVIRSLRKGGMPVFFTVDAGPQVKAICLPEAKDTVVNALRAVSGVVCLTESPIGPGARLIDPSQV